MSRPNFGAIETVPELLVHGLELERESAERYLQLAQTMVIHHNAETAELFRRLADMSDAHVSAIVARAEGLGLPDIAPWDFKWSCPHSPEADCFDSDRLNYLMRPLDALKLALHNEIRGRDFYAHVANTSPVPAVRALAGEMAAEEDDHVDILKEWIAREGLTEGHPREDPDPPNMTD